METATDDLSFDEKKTLQVIQTAILTAKRNLMDDGILLFSWGFAFAVSNLWKYYKSVVLTAWWFRNFMDIVQWILGIGVILFTIYFLFFRKKGTITYTATSTRFVWIGVILAHNLMVMITKIYLKDVDFTLLQPLQMILIGFALFVTGGIYRYYLLTLSGLVMWAAAVMAARYTLNIQFLIRSVAEILCFVVPGILMFLNSNLRKKNV